MPLLSLIMPDSSIVKMTCNSNNVCFMRMSCQGNKIWQRSIAHLDENDELSPLKQTEVQLAIAFTIVQCWKKMKQAEHLVPPVDIEG
jgi:hypothetical protein